MKRIDYNFTIPGFMGRRLTGRRLIVRCLIVVTGFCYPMAALSLEIEKYFKRPDQRGVDLFEQGLHQEALGEFEDPQWRGVSRYRNGEFEAAMQDFGGAEDANGLYNHGTAATRAGNYDLAIQSLTEALKLAPENKNIAHNLEIAKKLKALAEEQQEQQQDQQGEQQSPQQEENESDAAENEDSAENESQQSDQAQDGDQQSEQQSDAQSSESQNQSDSQADSNTQTGEMDSQESEQSSDNTESEQALRDMMQQEQAEQEQNDVPKNETPAVAGSSVSEDDQATEQWLRRIPDDASQLLRNKIRLNHLIEYSDVNDMQEPW